MIAAPSTAPAIARSTSAKSALGTVSSTESSNGLRTSRRSDLSIHWPAMNIFMVNTQGGE